MKNRTSPNPKDKQILDPAPIEVKAEPDGYAQNAINHPAPAPSIELLEVVNFPHDLFKSVSRIHFQAEFVGL